jgi:hypothetical protein
VILRRALSVLPNTLSGVLRCLGESALAARVAVAFMGSAMADLAHCLKLLILPERRHTMDRRGCTAGDTMVQ